MSTTYEAKVADVGPPVNLEAEESVLGAMLVTHQAVGAVLDTGLRPEHFYRDSHRAIYQTIMQLSADGRPADPLLVADAGNHDRDRVAALAARVPAAGNATQYAQVVIDKARWRRLQQASCLIAQAAQAEDTELLVQGESLIAEDVARPSSDYSGEELRKIARRLLTEGGAEAFPWPFERLNDKTAGGMRRGEFIVIGGHTSHGKSIFADQVLERCAKAGASVRLYMNEMALEERVARTVARRSGVPYRRIIEGRLDDEQREVVEHEIEKWEPYGITTVSGWTVDEITAHIRRYSWDVVLIDILHLIGYSDTRELDQISGALANCARQTNCCLLVTAHLNEGRVTSQVRPRPTLGDIRGSGQIKNDADTVLFVYQQQDKDTGFPLNGPSDIYFAKVRNGEVGGMRANFNAKRLRFDVA